MKAQDAVVDLSFEDARGREIFAHVDQDRGPLEGFLHQALVREAPQEVSSRFHVPLQTEHQVAWIAERLRGGRGE